MNKTESIVGTWRVKTVGAPFPYHMFAFHGDGTMHQTNPPAGNTETSDTAGLGVWEARGKKIKARFEEFRLDFKTGEVTRGVIDCTITVKGDELTGDCDFNIYNVADGSHVGGPHHATLEGERVVL
jgi:hypothetical protein